jgi:hypothetical protein
VSVVFNHVQPKRKQLAAGLYHMVPVVICLVFLWPVFLLSIAGSVNRGKLPDFINKPRRVSVALNCPMSSIYRLSGHSR